MSGQMTLDDLRAITDVDWRALQSPPGAQDICGQCALPRWRHGLPFDPRLWSFAVCDLFADIAVMHDLERLIG